MKPPTLPIEYTTWHWADAENPDRADLLKLAYGATVLTIVVRPVVFGQAPVDLTPNVTGEFVPDTWNRATEVNNQYYRYGNLSIRGAGTMRAVLASAQQRPSMSNKFFHYISPAGRGLITPSK